MEPKSRGVQDPRGSLSSGAHSRDTLARNDGSPPEPSWLFENRIA